MRFFLEQESVVSEGIWKWGIIGRGWQVPKGRSLRPEGSQPEARRAEAGLEFLGRGRQPLPTPASTSGGTL